MGVGARPATPVRIVGGGQVQEGSSEWAAIDKSLDKGKAAAGAGAGKASAAAPKAAKAAKATA